MKEIDIVILHLCAIISKLSLFAGATATMLNTNTVIDKHETKKSIVMNNIFAIFSFGSVDT